MMKTKYKGSWAVRLWDFTTINSMTLQFRTQSTFAIFEPAFPYIYLPEKDFLSWQGAVATYYKKQGVRCNNLPRGYCYFEHTCNHVRSFFDMSPQYFRIGD
jgi:hypothetical protein